MTVMKVTKRKAGKTPAGARGKVKRKAGKTGLATAGPHPKAQPRKAAGPAVDDDDADERRWLDW